MRIISGKNKGRRIQAPKNLPVRPTTDMAKESLFNILRNHYHLEGLSVLDLFAGTGNIAYEFCSRGAEKVMAVDGNIHCIKFITKTSEDLDFPLEVVKSDVYKFLEKSPFQFDIIFADPPYDFEEDKFLAIAQMVFERKLLKEEGMLIIEHSKFTSLESHPNFSFSKKYGGNVFSFFE